MRFLQMALCVGAAGLLAASAAGTARAVVVEDNPPAAVDGNGSVQVIGIGGGAIVVEAEVQPAEQAKPAEKTDKAPDEKASPDKAPDENAPAQEPVKPKPRAIRAAPALRAIKRIQVAPAQKAIRQARPIKGEAKKVRPAEAPAEVPEQAVPAQPAGEAGAVRVVKPLGDGNVPFRSCGWEPPRMMPLAYLGVATSSPNETLRRQLGLPTGAGLVVDYVDKDGPAAAAGVQVHDVLTRLDDQILVNPPQLAVLVRMHQADDKVALMFVRGGKERKATATLVEKEQAVSADGTPLGWSGMWQGVVPPVPPRTLEDLIKKGEAAPTGVQAHTVATGFNMVMADGEHTLRVTTENGKRHLKATDAQGNVVFEGPIETDAQRAAVPDDIRKKLDRMEPKVEIRLEGGPGQGGIRIQAVPRRVGPMKAVPRIQAVPAPKRLQRQPLPAQPAEEAPEDTDKPDTDKPEKPEDAAGKAAEKRVQAQAQVQVQGGGGAARSEVRIQDKEHDICITAGEKGGRLVAKDAKTGKVLYDGPINTDEDLKKVPPAIREKIKGIQVNATMISD